MKKLILAEKPSVARNIADALGKTQKHDGYLESEDYLITWAFGHLLSLKDVKDYDPSKASWQIDNFPFIPKVFEYKIKANMKDRDKADYGAKKQLDIIKSLCQRQDVSEIISACDYDREGQIIGDIIFKVLKPKQDVYRLLLNEWTQSAVLDGLKNLIPNKEMLALRDAGISRQWADWVIGINFTSMATLKFSKSRQVLNVGRVLMPTLKILYDRMMEIQEFNPQTYYKLTALFLKDTAFEGVYHLEKQDQFSDKKVLEDILNHLNSIKDLKGHVHKKVEKEKKEHPPRLFNLSALQGYITGKYRNFTASKVLKVAQSLYEKKYITYPRTESVALEESLIGRCEKIVDTLKKGLPYEDQIQFKVSKRVFDNGKVKSHSAIIPTYLMPKSLSEDEKIIYNAIKNRLLSQFMPVAIYGETKLEIKLDKHLFKASGRVLIQMGWKVIEGFKKQDHVLPQVEENDLLDVRALNITSHETQPPKLHTEQSLLKYMETCGKRYEKDHTEEMIEQVLKGFSIGTAATRADVITRLIKIGYVNRDRKTLVISDLGRQMVETFPVKSLFDLDYTGKLEKKLADVEKGYLTRVEFLKEIFKYTQAGVDLIKKESNLVLRPAEPKEILGVCPSCGGDIIETKRSFSCSNWKTGCKYSIWKNDKFFASMKKKPTKTMVKSLLKSKKVFVKGFTGKNGQKFNAYVSYDPSDDGYRWHMTFK